MKITPRRATLLEHFVTKVFVITIEDRNGREKDINLSFIAWAFYAWLFCWFVL